jgi:hypothetical protein
MAGAFRGNAPADRCRPVAAAGITCCDRLTGAITVPQAVVQLCVVQLIRASL